MWLCMYVRKNSSFLSRFYVNMHKLKFVQIPSYLCNLSKFHGFRFLTLCIYIFFRQILWLYLILKYKKKNNNIYNIIILWKINIRIEYLVLIISAFKSSNSGFPLLNTILKTHFHKIYMFQFLSGREL